MESGHPIVNVVTQALLAVFVVGLGLLGARTFLTMSSLLIRPWAGIVLRIPILRMLVTASKAKGGAYVANEERIDHEHREPREI